jgi:hypothetical protein
MNLWDVGKKITKKKVACVRAVFRSVLPMKSNLPATPYGIRYESLPITLMELLVEKKCRKRLPLWSELESWG